MGNETSSNPGDLTYSDFEVSDEDMNSTSRPWSSTPPSFRDSPVTPPEPDLAHLTDEERQQIAEVLARAKQLEQDEDERIRALETDVFIKKPEFEGICPVCESTELYPGEVRTGEQDICADCERLICINCGDYVQCLSSKLQEWLCHTCQKRRHLTLSSGGWFHGYRQKPCFKDLETLPAVIKFNKKSLERTTSLSHYEDFKEEEQKSVTRHALTRKGSLPSCLNEADETLVDTHSLEILRDQINTSQRSLTESGDSGKGSIEDDSFTPNGKKPRSDDDDSLKRQQRPRSLSLTRQGSSEDTPPESPLSSTSDRRRSSDPDRVKDGQWRDDWTTRSKPRDTVRVIVSQDSDPEDESKKSTPRPSPVSPVKLDASSESLRSSASSDSDYMTLDAGDSTGIIDLATYAATISSNTAQLTNLSASPTSFLGKAPPSESREPSRDLSPDSSNDSLEVVSPCFYEDDYDVELADPSEKSVDYQNTVRQKVKPPTTDWSPVTDLSPIEEIEFEQSAAEFEENFVPISALRRYQNFEDISQLQERLKEYDEFGRLNLNEVQELTERVRQDHLDEEELENSVLDGGSPVRRTLPQHEMISNAITSARSTGTSLFKSFQTYLNADEQAKKDAADSSDSHLGAVGGAPAPVPGRPISSQPVRATPPSGGFTPPSAAVMAPIVKVNQPSAKPLEAKIYVSSPSLDEDTKKPGVSAKEMKAKPNPLRLEHIEAEEETGSPHYKVMKSPLTPESQNLLHQYKDFDRTPEDDEDAFPYPSPVTPPDSDASPPKPQSPSVPDMMDELDRDGRPMSRSPRPPRSTASSQASTPGSNDMDGQRQRRRLPQPPREGPFSLIKTPEVMKQLNEIAKKVFEEKELKRWFNLEETPKEPDTNGPRVRRKLPEIPDEKKARAQKEQAKEARARGDRQSPIGRDEGKKDDSRRSDDPRRKPRDPRDPRDPRISPRESPRDPRAPRDPRMESPVDPRDMRVVSPNDPRDPRTESPRDPRDPRVESPRDPRDPRVESPRDTRDPRVESPRDPRDPRVGSPRDTRDPRVESPRDLRDPRVESPRDPRDPRVESPRDPRDPRVESPRDTRDPRVESPRDPRDPRVGSPRDTRDPRVESPRDPRAPRVESPKDPRVESPRDPRRRELEERIPGVHSPVDEHGRRRPRTDRESPRESPRDPRTPPDARTGSPDSLGRSPTSDSGRDSRRVEVRVERSGIRLNRGASLEGRSPVSPEERRVTVDRQDDRATPEGRRQEPDRPEGRGHDSRRRRSRESLEDLRRMAPVNEMPSPDRRIAEHPETPEEERLARLGELTREQWSSDERPPPEDLAKRSKKPGDTTDDDLRKEEEERARRRRDERRRGDDGGRRDSDRRDSDRRDSDRRANERRIAEQEERWRAEQVERRRMMEREESRSSDSSDERFRRGDGSSRTPSGEEEPRLRRTSSGGEDPRLRRTPSGGEDPRLRRTNSGGDRRRRAPSDGEERVADGTTGSPRDRRSDELRRDDRIDEEAESIRLEKRRTLRRRESADIDPDGRIRRTDPLKIEKPPEVDDTVNKKMIERRVQRTSSRDKILADIDRQALREHRRRMEEEEIIEEERVRRQMEGPRSPTRRTPPEIRTETSTRSPKSEVVPKGRSKKSSSSSTPPIESPRARDRGEGSITSTPTRESPSRRENSRVLVSPVSGHTSPRRSDRDSPARVHDRRTPPKRDDAHFFPEQERNSPRGRDSPSRGRDSPQRGKDSPSRGQDSPSRGQDSPQRGKDSPQRGQDSPSRGQDSPSRGTRDSPRTMEQREKEREARELELREQREREEKELKEKEMREKARELKERELREKERERELKEKERELRQREIEEKEREIREREIKEKERVIRERELKEKEREIREREMKEKEIQRELKERELRELKLKEQERALRALEIKEKERELRELELREKERELRDLELREKEEELKERERQLKSRERARSQSRDRNREDEYLDRDILDGTQYGSLDSRGRNRYRDPIREPPSRARSASKSRPDEVLHFYGLHVPKSVKTRHDLMCDELKLVTYERRRQLEELTEIKLLELQLEQIRELEERQRSSLQEKLLENKARLEELKQRRPRQNASPTTAQIRRGRHRRQNSDPALAKFSPIEEYKDIAKAFRARDDALPGYRYRSLTPSRPTPVRQPPPSRSSNQYGQESGLSRLCRSSEHLKEDPSEDRFRFLTASQSERSLQAALESASRFADQQPHGTFYGEPERDVAAQRRIRELEAELQYAKEQYHHTVNADEIGHERDPYSVGQEIWDLENEEIRSRYDVTEPARSSRTTPRVDEYGSAGIIKPLDEFDGRSRRDRFLRDPPRSAFTPIQKPAKHEIYSSSEYLAHKHEAGSQYMGFDQFYADPRDMSPSARSQLMSSPKSRDRQAHVHSNTLPRTNQSQPSHVTKATVHEVPFRDFTPIRVEVDPGSPARTTNGETPAMPLLGDVTSKSRKRIHDIQTSRPTSGDYDNYYLDQCNDSSSAIAQDFRELHGEGGSENSYGDPDEPIMEHMTEGGVTIQKRKVNRQKLNKAMQDAFQSLEPAPKKYRFPYKRILITRDAKDRSIKGNGLGMKIVGGKCMPGTEETGAFVQAIYAGGVANQLHGELREGDQILEWNGIDMIGRTYEEVQWIISQPQTEIEIVVKPANMSLSIPASDSKTSTAESTVKSESSPSIYDNMAEQTDDTSDYDSFVASQQGVDPAVLAAQLEGIKDRMSPGISPTASLRDLANTQLSPFNQTPEQATPRRRAEKSPNKIQHREQENHTSAVEQNQNQNQHQHQHQHQHQQPKELLSFDGNPPKTMEVKPQPQPSPLPARREPKGKIMGEIQLQMDYDDYDESMSVRVIQAKDLVNQHQTATLNPYVRMYLLPGRGPDNRRKTNYIADSRTPEWHHTFVFVAVPRSELKNRSLEVSVWNCEKGKSHECVGEVIVYFDDERYLDNQPHWFVLREGTASGSDNSLSASDSAGSKGKKRPFGRPSMEDVHEASPRRGKGMNASMNQMDRLSPKPRRRNPYPDEGNLDKRKQDRDLDLDKKTPKQETRALVHRSSTQPDGRPAARETTEEPLEQQDLSDGNKERKDSNRPLPAIITPDTPPSNSNPSSPGDTQGDGDTSSPKRPRTPPRSPRRRHKTSSSPRSRHDSGRLSDKTNGDTPRSRRESPRHRDRDPRKEHSTRGSDSPKRTDMSPKNRRARDAREENPDKTLSPADRGERDSSLRRRRSPRPDSRTPRIVRQTSQTERRQTVSRQGSSTREDRQGPEFLDVARNKPKAAVTPMRRRNTSPGSERTDEDRSDTSTPDTRCASESPPNLSRRSLPPGRRRSSPNDPYGSISRDRRRDSGKTDSSPGSGSPQRRSRQDIAPGRSDSVDSREHVPPERRKTEPNLGQHLTPGQRPHDSPSMRKRALSPVRRRMQRTGRYQTAPAKFEITPDPKQKQGETEKSTVAPTSTTTTTTTTTTADSKPAEKKPATEPTSQSPRSIPPESNSTPKSPISPSPVSATSSPKSSLINVMASIAPQFLLSADPSPRSSFSDNDSRKSSLSTALPPMSGESSRKASDASIMSFNVFSRKTSDASMISTSRKVSDASIRSPLPEGSPRSPTARLTPHDASSRCTSARNSISPVQALFPLQPPPHRRSIKCPPPQRPPMEQLPRSLTSPGYLENSPVVSPELLNSSPRSPKLSDSKMPYSRSLDDKPDYQSQQTSGVFRFPGEYDDDTYPQSKELSEREVKQRQYIDALRKMVGPGQLLPTDVMMNSRQNCRLLDRYMVGEILLNLRRDLSICTMKITIIQCRHIRVSDQNRQNIHGVYVTLYLSSMSDSGTNSPCSSMSSTAHSLTSIVSEKRSIASDLLNTIMRGRRGDKNEKNPKRKRTQVRKFNMEPLIQEKFTYELVREQQTLQLSLWASGRGFFSKNWKLGDTVISLDEIRPDPDMHEDVVDVTHWYKVLLPTVDLCYDIS